MLTINFSYIFLLYQYGANIYPGKKLSKTAPPYKYMMIDRNPNAEQDREFDYIPNGTRIGGVLQTMISCLGIEEKDIYATALVKCAAKTREVPPLECFSNCSMYIRAELKLVNVNVLILLGQAVFDNFFPGYMFAVTDILGEIILTEIDGKAYYVIPMVHPGYYMANRLELETLNDKLKEVRAFLKGAF